MNSNLSATEQCALIPETIRVQYPQIETWAASHDDINHDDINQDDINQDDINQDDTVSDALAYLCDAQSDIGEDFMQVEIDRLSQTVKAMRKSDTKDMLLTIVDEFGYLQQRIASTAEYELEHLNKARAVFAGEV